MSVSSVLGVSGGSNVHTRNKQIEIEIIVFITKTLKRILIYVHTNLRDVGSYCQD